MICSGSLYSCFSETPLEDVFSSDALPSAGDMGIVSRGTGEDGLAALELGTARLVMAGGVRKDDQDESTGV